MNKTGKHLATRLIRATAPKGLFDCVIKFALFMVVIHLVSLTAERLLIGRFALDHLQRFLITFITAAPFVALTFYAIHRSWRLHQRLVALATTDMLTGLMNRRAFVDAAAMRIARDEPGLVLIVDADRFKRINDSFGHAVGDKCLKAIAARLRDVTPRGDIVARIGGEEFGIHLSVMPGDVTTFERRLCSQIAVDHTTEDGLPLTLTLSGGLAHTLPGDTLESVLRRADDALYQAKQDGRARLTIWQPPAPTPAVEPILLRAVTQPAC